MLDNMYTIDDIKSMSGTNDRALAGALLEGLNLFDQTRRPTLPGRFLTIGALVAGTVFSGCAGNSREAHNLTVPEPTLATEDSVNRLAMDIANGIVDEMDTASAVTTTQSWQAAKDIYGKLVDGNRKDLADMFARTINRKKNEFFNAPPCCDSRAYNNKEQQQQDHTPVYNEETGMMEYN